MKAKIGILTLSDRASKGIYEDLSGAAIRQILDEWIVSEREYFYEVIADDFKIIKERLIYMSDKLGCDLILTTGGTGPAERDVTPEATEAVCKKIMPGFGELMRAASLKFVPTAILSRQTAGIRAHALIVNLPGQPKAIRECLEPIFPAVPYCIDLIGGVFIETDESKM
ncbi:MAG: molybdopterin adenylyltransferase, partial [Campylobacter curvus]